MSWCVYGSRARRPVRLRTLLSCPRPVSSSALRVLLCVLCASSCPPFWLCRLPRPAFSFPPSPSRLLPFPPSPSRLLLPAFSSSRLPSSRLFSFPPSPLTAFSSSRLLPFPPSPSRLLLHRPISACMWPLIIHLPVFLRGNGHKSTRATVFKSAFAPLFAPFPSSNRGPDTTPNPSLAHLR